MGSLRSTFNQTFGGLHYTSVGFGGRVVINCGGLTSTTMREIILCAVIAFGRLDLMVLVNLTTTPISMIYAFRGTDDHLQLFHDYKHASMHMHAAFKNKVQTDRIM